MIEYFACERRGAKKTRLQPTDPHLPIATLVCVVDWPPTSRIAWQIGQRHDAAYHLASQIGNMARVTHHNRDASPMDGRRLQALEPANQESFRSLLQRGQRRRLYSETNSASDIVYHLPDHAGKGQSIE